MKYLKVISAAVAFCLWTFSSLVSADELYGYSYWAGHNKNMYISDVYHFTAERQGNYVEMSFDERNIAFSRYLDANGYESKTYDYSRRDSRQAVRREDANDDLENTIITWKGMGYDVRRVPFSWRGR